MGRTLRTERNRLNPSLAGTTSPTILGSQRIDYRGIVLILLLLEPLLRRKKSRIIDHVSIVLILLLLEPLLRLDKNGFSPLQTYEVLILLLLEPLLRHFICIMENQQKIVLILLLLEPLLRPGLYFAPVPDNKCLNPSLAGTTSPTVK